MVFWGIKLTAFSSLLILRNTMILFMRSKRTSFRKLISLSLCLDTSPPKMVKTSKGKAERKSSVNWVLRYSIAIVFGSTHSWPKMVRVVRNDTIMSITKQMSAKTFKVSKTQCLWKRFKLIIIKGSKKVIKRYHLLQFKRRFLKADRYSCMLQTWW